MMSWHFWLMWKMNLPIGTILKGGTYRIVRFIGSGGFGCTYEAEHIELDEKVAIKEFFVKDLEASAAPTRPSILSSMKKSLSRNFS